MPEPEQELDISTPDLVRAHIDAGLLPEQRHRAPHLDEGGSLAICPRFVLLSRKRAQDHDSVDAN